MVNAKQAGVLVLAAALLWLSPATAQQQEHHWELLAKRLPQGETDTASTATHERP